MSRLADATTCPDCRAPLDPGSTCTACGLRLAGPPGERLWQLMLGADRLVEEIRATSTAPVTVPALEAVGRASGHGDPVVVQAAVRTLVASVLRLS